MTTKADIADMCQATGLRLYTECVAGVEVHRAGLTIRKFKTRALAYAFIEGWHACTLAGPDRTVAGKTEKG